MTFVPPPGYMPSFNPPLPYVAPVPGGLSPGMVVYVEGVVAPKADWFRINLAAGPEDTADLALHLNPRFGAGVAVLNSRSGGHWGDEQRRELHPLCPGGAFELVISVTPEGYRILVNGTFYEEFPHRLPPEQVTTVNVDGDLELHSASVLGSTDTPKITPMYHSSNLAVMAQAPILYPSVPFIGNIPGGLVPKKTIIIKGFVPQHARRFHINLRVGPSGDVVLHVNPRMDENNAVVRNALLADSWGNEERDLITGTPFLRGRFFDLSIRCGSNEFKVFADGQPLFNFHYRVPIGPHVDMLEIKGDVSLSYVYF
ncbi:LOW QUALITY PROTEIN: galectin-4-like [Anomalospiza imberbis]|uniref:LOW QUALITY PROTEIN: galectin-4-like n=1 Tax=Anomalospiza imberbis TaxID=187417 RepID=UPI00358FDE90